ncbi:hypothetical protein SAMN05192588_2230 [Nonlabens sp. Hel1_33_55]|uniref:hypothetical protein n=1 Tax=Nonlabens sp. Hel1_33_55 TaxID=1336802 RepID=UPI000875DC81|nr:hypothetical protein [Nonlabens sp. Hel1_33_55]SCY31915.1 hypothetical protein SAMN05192588_2230 [Nonlabens sp. Hel1_33_55]
MTLKNKPAVWFWILAVILLLWNIMGLIAFLTEAIAPELFTESFNQEQMDLYNNRPVWYMYNFAIAVFAGTFSCIMLLARKKFAVTLAIFSFLAVLISTGYTVYSGALDLVGISDKVLFYLVLVLDLILVLFAMYAAKKRWIA